MAWIDNDGYMHGGDEPPGFTYAPHGGPPPTDIDQYGRKIGSPGAGLPEHGDLRPIPGQPPDPAPIPVALAGQPDVLPVTLAGQADPGLQTQSTDPNGRNYVPPGGNMPPTDPNAAAKEAQRKLDQHFQYGGTPYGAQQDAGYFRGQAEGAQQRQGEQINYGRANQYDEQAQARANAQLGMADLMAARARGLVPSIAQQQADRQMNQAAAEQSSAAASARGPAAMALAQQGAAANTAGMQSTISNQAQINAATERERAEQAAFGAYSGMRGQDFQFMGAHADMAQKQAALNAAQRAQNDQYSMGLYNNEIDINKAQLGAQGNQIGLETGAGQGNANRDQAAQQHSDDQTWKIIGLGAGGLATAGGIAGMAYFGGGRGGGGAPMTVGGGDPSGYGVPGGSDPSNAPGDGYYTDDGRWISSDVTAKQNIRPLQAAAWDEGRKAALEDMRRLAGKSGQELKAYGDTNPLASEVRNMRANAWDEGRKGLVPQQATQGDPVTAQFAQGLAPSAYDYKPGMPGATPGTKVGPMAQNMASNDITGTAVRQNPHTGLLGIDSKDGLKVALGGVGHLAEKQRQTDAAIAQLMAQAKQMQQGTQAQSEGLMSQGSSVGDQYLSYVRGGGQ